MKTTLIVLFLLVVIFFGTLNRSTMSFDARVNPTSCYDCEREGSSKTKCFQCGDVYPSPTKCFTCKENPMLWRDGVMYNKKPVL